MRTYNRTHSHGDTRKTKFAGDIRAVLLQLRLHREKKTKVISYLIIMWYPGVGPSTASS